MHASTISVHAGDSGLGLRKFFGDPEHWVAQTGLWATTVVLIAARQGALLTYAFPCIAVAAGLWLYFRSPARYVGFIWWIWFLSPEVRRLADWSRGAYVPTSLIQIAPLAVTMIACFGLLRHHRVLAERRGLPVLPILLGIAYAYFVGIVSSGLLAATYDLANWLYPVLIGFHITVHARNYPLYRATILSTFIWGMLVMGIYGAVQFFVMPNWDALWMIGSQMNSQGDPVPYGVRVFSTMNSSGPFAFVMMGALVFMFAATERVRWIAGAAGFVSFMLCLVRSAWGGWAIALLIQLVKSSNRARMRIIGGAIVLGALCLPILTAGPIGDRLGQRLQSILSLKDDRSYDDRNKFFAAFAQTAFTDVEGEGLGATGASTKLSSDSGGLGKYGSFDSGVMNVPFVLGWPGTLLYLCGLVWLLVRAVRASFRLRGDKFATACLSLCLSIFAMLVFTNSFIGTGGLLLYTSVFSILSAAHWQKLQKIDAAHFTGNCQ
ncbi:MULTISPECIES: glucose-6-phosphate isomerase [Burkholderia]|uniref:glucose-6-phosphate isomerase n=1 Tax=Burkholderia TaxID=32008 RepID=UPI000841FF59|nr:MULTISPECIES: glucose-6-phosphate isomerase [unclassified Burkholderia]AOK31383.1 glucose-6-phosphate isomerase [Burkholderia sp. Bp7605]